MDIERGRGRLIHHIGADPIKPGLVILFQYHPLKKRFIDRNMAEWTLLKQIKSFQRAVRINIPKKKAHPKHLPTAYDLSGMVHVSGLNIVDAPTVQMLHPASGDRRPHRLHRFPFQQCPRRPAFTSLRPATSTRRDQEGNHPDPQSNPGQNQIQTT